MQVTPYIIFGSNCEQALNFYTNVFGGTIKDLMRYKDAPGENRMGMDGENVMHAVFEVDGNLVLMASDGPGGGTGTGMAHLSLNFTDAGSIQAAFAAMSDGAKITMPLQDTFWGATFGMLTDQFGVNWMFNYEKART